MKYGKLSRKNIETLERLAETPEGKTALAEFVEKQKEARKAHKRYVKLINKEEKTPNEIRAAFIEKCKRYIEKHGNGVEFYEGLGKRFTAKGLHSYCVSYTEGVYNDCIEKANALAWLLGDYDFVKETENAPQPMLAVGQILYHRGWGEECEVAINGLYLPQSSRCAIDSTFAKESVIIDDTNARYKEETK